MHPIVRVTKNTSFHIGFVIVFIKMVDPVCSFNSKVSYYRIEKINDNRSD